MTGTFHKDKFVFVKYRDVLSKSVLLLALGYVDQLSYRTSLYQRAVTIETSCYYRNE